MGRNSFGVVVSAPKALNYSNKVFKIILAKWFCARPKRFSGLITRLLPETLTWKALGAAGFMVENRVNQQVYFFPVDKRPAPGRGLQKELPNVLG